MSPHCSRPRAAHPGSAVGGSHDRRVELRSGVSGLAGARSGCHGSGPMAWAHGQATPSSGSCRSRSCWWARAFLLSSSNSTRSIYPPIILCLIGLYVGMCLGTKCLSKCLAASKEGSERLRTMAKKMICVAPDVVQRRGTCTRKAVK
ncbi:unnamed protein product [Urochloa humidicola]